MITSLRLVNFKNFADETLRLGPFTVIVGANASGKSNIRDAFRFLHGIGRGYTLAEIMGGKYGVGGQREWAGIRGAMNEIVRFRGKSRRKRGDFSVDLRAGRGGNQVFYSITPRFNRERVEVFRVWKEELAAEATNLFKTEIKNSTKLRVMVGKDSERPIALSRSQPALTQLLLHKRVSKLRIKDSSLDVHYLLGNMRFFDLMPDRMRQPSFPGQTVLGDSGENLATVLDEICQDADRQSTLISWLQELTPMDVKCLEFPRDPSGQVHLQIVERNGRSISAYSASDGTLRFLAMLAALLGANPAGVYFFEEIDNGIHPSRLHLLIDLIESQTKSNGIQVITTTHSPEMLNLISDSTFENTSVVYRDEESSDAVIRPASDLPNAKRLRKSKGLGRLHSTGWMEDMLAFAEADREAGEAGE